MSPFPIPCVNRTSTNSNLTRYGFESSQDEDNLQSSRLVDGDKKMSDAFTQSERGEDDWVRDINTLLRFNASFSGRGLLGGKGAYEESDDK